MECFYGVLLVLLCKKLPMIYKLTAYSSAHKMEFTRQYWDFPEGELSMEKA